MQRMRDKIADQKKGTVVARTPEFLFQGGQKIGTMFNPFNRLNVTHRLTFDD
jgi:hypothetical protein